MKKIYCYWLEISILIFVILMAAGLFIYASSHSTDYAISKGFIAGSASGIILGAILRNRREKKAKNKKAEILSLLLISFILGWFFYESVIKHAGSIYYYVGGVVGGIFVTFPIYVIVIIYTRYKNKKSRVIEG